MRVTPSGFDKLTSLIPPLVNDALDAGFCIPPTSIGLGIDICTQNDGPCAPGCQVELTTESIEMSVPNTESLHIDVRLDVRSDIFVDSLGGCVLDARINDGHIEGDIDLGIDPATGELTLTLSDFDTLDFTGADLSGCSVLGDVLDFVLDAVTAILDSFIGDFLADWLRPTIDRWLQGLLPESLGLEGMFDVGALFGSVVPGVQANLELRSEPGGFAELVQNGMTLGVVVGVNADRNVASRTPALDSEPALCVPPVPAPDFAAAPAPLTRTERQTFLLQAADAFRGAPEPDADIAIGISETALDLAGHHFLTSGALCMSVGTELVSQLTLGTIGLLVPSFGALGTGDEPLLLVVRPNRAIDFTIGDGTEGSPALTLAVHELELDFYAFVFQRYVRGFTIRLDADVRVDLDFMTTADGTLAILPVLSGLSSDELTVTALNAEFLRESSTELETALPAVLDLALPMILGSLSAFELPEIAGFRLSNPSLAKVVTSEDEFLAITADFVTPAALGTLAGKKPALAKALGAPEAMPARVRTRAALAAVRTPEPADIRAALAGAGGALPEVVIDVPSHDQQGRRLEWTWRLNHGIWRQFGQAAPLVIRDRALAMQGRHTIEVRARAAGDYRTLDLESVTIPVLVDSVPPALHAAAATISGDTLLVPARDLVSAGDAIEFAVGTASSRQPTTAWRRGGISLREVSHLATGNGRQLTVFARDEAGNTAMALVSLGNLIAAEPGQRSADAGWACSASGTDDLGGALGCALLALAFVLMTARTGRTRAPALPGAAGCSAQAGLRGRARSLLLSLVSASGVLAFLSMPGCTCGSDEMGMMEPPDLTCEMTEDCAAACPERTVPLCLDRECLCLDEPEFGQFGSYTDLAIDSQGTVWVSGYNSRYGDLSVAQWSDSGRITDEAWAYVDGVPDGPVQVAGAQTRSGIVEEGDDVGKGSSIAVSNDNVVMVSYYDQTHGSLKFAQRRGDAWHVHTVVEGLVPAAAGSPFALHGQYSSLTLSADGRPGIAYFAHISDDGVSARTELRFVNAQSTTPSAPADWTLYPIDQADVPAEPEAGDVLTLPPGLGLFVDSVRMSDDGPAVVYYDRIAGDLKLATFDRTALAFRPPVVLDGGDGSDVGWYPSITVDLSDVLHVSYLGATSDDLLYINTRDNVPEVVDDGYRVIDTTDAGYPKPAFHRVGADSSIVVANGSPRIIYQDATSHELLFARRSASEDGAWSYETLAGNEAEFAGGYGFYNAAQERDGELVIATWVLSPPQNRAWVEVFREPLIAEQ